MKNECEQITSAINNDIKKKDNILPEENVVKMRREIKIHDNKKRKEKRKRMQKDEQTRTLTSVFSLKKTTEEEENKIKHL